MYARYILLDIKKEKMVLFRHLIVEAMALRLPSAGSRVPGTRAAVRGSGQLAADIVQRARTIRLGTSDVAPQRAHAAPTDASDRHLPIIYYRCDLVTSV